MEVADGGISPLGGDAPSEQERNEIGDEQEWSELYKNASIAQMVDERNTLDLYLVEETADEFERRFQTGDYEFLGAGDSYDFAGWDPEAVCNVRIVPGRGVFKMTLPEAQFPDYYRIRRKINWLEHKADKQLLASRR